MSRKGAVNAHQVGHAGLRLTVQADNAVGVGHGALELAPDGVLVVGHQDETCLLYTSHPKALPVQRHGC